MDKKEPHPKRTLVQTYYIPSILSPSTTVQVMMKHFTMIELYKSPHTSTHPLVPPHQAATMYYCTLYTMNCICDFQLTHEQVVYITYIITPCSIWLQPLHRRGQPWEDIRGFKLIIPWVGWVSLLSCHSYTTPTSDGRLLSSSWQRFLHRENPRSSGVHVSTSDIPATRQLEFSRDPPRVVTLLDFNFYVQINR